MTLIDTTDRRFLRRLALWTLVLVAAAGGRTPAFAQPPTSPAENPSPPQSSAPQVSGTIVRVNNDRIDVKTSDGKTQKVALNESTKREVELKKGADVTVEYRRRIGDFVIAERVVAAGSIPAEQPVPVPDLKTASATGDVLSATDASLVLRTEEGDLTFFLSPSTEILVKPLTAGLRVTVDYREDKDQMKVATRIIPATLEEPVTPPPAEPTPPGR